jgi:predicted transcriptional regulator
VGEQSELSRRERQVMDAVYARREASATQVMHDLSDPPSRTAVRTFLRILEEKGLLKHRKEGREFIYSPIEARRSVGKSALRRVLRVFFDGSLEQAVAAHLTDSRSDLSPGELKRLAGLISQARKKGETRD